MHVLITGGAGFIGSHVGERLLALGHEVTAFDDLNAFYDPSVKHANLAVLTAVGGPRFRFVHGDITDRPALDAVCNATPFDQVIHLAARAGVPASLREPALYQRVNVEGTVQVLEAARTAGCRKFILASSSSVYGLSTRLPFREDDPVGTVISPYAASKLACEALGHTYHRLYGLDVAMLRFFTVYGPRQRPDLAIFKFATRIAAGLPIPVFGDGSACRDYTFVTDIVDGVVACTERRLGFEIFNLGESQTTRLDELIRLLERALGRPAIVDRQPLQPGDVPATFADISKARRLLGYRPRVPVAEGIPKFVEWFRQRAL